MSTPSLISVIIVSLNGEDRLPDALRAVQATRWPRFEIVVVDNGSTDRTSEVTRRIAPEARCLRVERNLGFAGGNNVGLAEARGDVLVLLNDDCEPRPDWLAAWMDAARSRPEWGVLGAKLLYPDGRTIQHAGGVMEPNGLTKHLGYMETDEGQHDTPRECDYVSGAAFAIRRDVLERVGPLDAAYFPIYFEENDFCARVRRAGFGVHYIPAAAVIHHESMTTKKLSFGFLKKYHRNRLRYVIKNFDAPQLRRAARREIGWLVRAHPWDCYIPVALAYAHALWRLPELLRARRETLRGAT